MPAGAIDAEARVALRRARARRLHGLYALTPDMADTGALVAAVSAALDGGAAAVQYRSKDSSRAHRADQARALARVLAARGGVYIVNDDACLALEAGADGVHIGADDGSITAAREILGPDRLIGVSCYGDLSRAADAVAQGADYVAFGSFFPSCTKPHAPRADPVVLARARRLEVPIVAIGGITAANAGTLVEAGADALAVIGDLFGDIEPAAVQAAADALVRVLARHARALT